jgi:hypothetical protein
MRTRSSSESAITLGRVAIAAPFTLPEPSAAWQPAQVTAYCRAPESCPTPCANMGISASTNRKEKTNILVDRAHFIGSNVSRNQLTRIILEG